MGLLDRFKNEFIDIIEWTDDSNDTIAYRFERFQNEIKTGAKLTVREGQAAVFVNEGKIADVFTPGLHTLTTENLPILSTLKGWKYGFNSPFKAEVYFFKTTKFTDQKWGTKNPITLSDPRFGMLEIRAFGTYVYRINKPDLFLKEIVGTDGDFTTEEISNQLRSIMVTRFTDAVAEANLPVESYAAQLNELSEFVENAIAGEFLNYGIELTKVLIENVSMPEEVKKEIFELSRLESVNLDKLTKLKAAQAMEAAAKNENGAAGAGMGMGMGFGILNTIQTNAMQPTQQTQPTQQNASAPPPIPGAVSYFIVENGKQAGPYNMSELKAKISANQFQKDTLVWKEGMANWITASEVSDISTLFGSVPPPIPPQ